MKVKIVKFEPSQGKELEYTFYGAFPINFSSTSVQYGSSDVLRASVTFNYERYIAGKETSKSKQTNTNENNSGTVSMSTRDPVTGIITPIINGIQRPDLINN